jgi:hypothetical protein
MVAIEAIAIIAAMLTRLGNHDGRFMLDIPGVGFGGGR